jgi:hypothetical protein
LRRCSCCAAIVSFPAEQPHFALPFGIRFAHNPAMENETGPAADIRGFVRWAITPPQSYAVYLVCLFLVLGASFYAGTLKPKKAPPLSPPPTSAPAVPRS